MVALQCVNIFFLSLPWANLEHMAWLPWQPEHFTSLSQASMEWPFSAYFIHALHTHERCLICWPLKHLRRIGYVCLYTTVNVPCFNSCRKCVPLKRQHNMSRLNLISFSAHFILLNSYNYLLCGKSSSEITCMTIFSEQRHVTHTAGSTMCLTERRATLLYHLGLYLEVPGSHFPHGTRHPYNNFLCSGYCKWRYFTHHKLHAQSLFSVLPRHDSV